MTSIAGLVDHYGHGLLHKRQLVRHGAKDHHLTLAVRNGEVRRARRGWYTTWRQDDPRFVAVRVGGRLTGASALAQLGAWAWRHSPQISVSVPANASRLRRKRRVRVVWDRFEVQERGSAWAVSLTDALREAIVEVGFEEGVAALDWALHEQRVTMDDVAEIVRTLPDDVQQIVDWVDPLCDSFLESVARTRLRKAGYHVRSQGQLPKRKRIDLVVEEVVGVETDGQEHHLETFESDRRKDLSIVVDGRIPMRLSYSMVRDEWESIEEAMGFAVAMHRLGPSSPSGNSGPPRHLGPGDRRAWRLPAPRRRARPELPKGAPGQPPKARRERPLVRHRYDR
ncbi:glycyl-tRNA synthetase [Frondihabitans sp. PAMC 28766]|uniref:glycyl-tRNA synthetase n=1 Tax=Frondihabitans sp. PAMC 28766 TaxID=1795630 RepID=UPI000B0AC68F|nr:glycyl-tRNA synthetase [Frondihabitans sp. PAMC 28766]